MTWRYFPHIAEVPGTDCVSQLLLVVCIVLENLEKQMKGKFLKLGVAIGMTAATVMSAGSAYALSITKSSTTGGSFGTPGNPTITRSINFTRALTITDLFVIINGFNHTKTSDVVANLIYKNSAGAETTINLFENKGSGRDLNGNYTFRDGGAKFPGVGNPIPAAGFYKAQGGSFLSTFNDSMGTWTLSLSDGINIADKGSFDSWDLRIDGEPIAGPVPVPAPAAVLPGLIGMGAAALRKRRQEDGAVEEA